MTNRSNNNVVADHGPAGLVFFLAFIGALVYFIQQSEGFWEVMLAILKAMVWPAYMVFYAMKALQI